MYTKIELVWFTDQGNGELAATLCGKAIRGLYGPWPCAKVLCNNHADAERKWWALWKNYGVNAMTHSEWK